MLGIKLRIFTPRFDKLYCAFRSWSAVEGSQGRFALVSYMSARSPRFVLVFDDPHTDSDDILHIRLCLSCRKSVASTKAAIVARVEQDNLLSLSMLSRGLIPNNGSQHLKRLIHSAMHSVFYERSQWQRKRLTNGFEVDAGGDLNGIGGKRYNQPLKHRFRNVSGWHRLQSTPLILMLRKLQASVANVFCSAPRKELRL